VLWQPRELRGLERLRLDVGAADKQLARPVGDLPREVLGRAGGGCGRVDALGGDDAVEEAREGGLARRDGDDDVARRA